MSPPRSLDLRRLVAQIDARLDDGRGLAGLDGLPCAWSGPLPPHWLQLDPGTGARHLALTKLTLTGLTQAVAVAELLAELRSTEPRRDWTEPCLILARSDPRLVVPALERALVEVADAMPSSSTHAWRLLTLAAQLHETEEARRLVPRLLDLLSRAATNTPAITYLVTLTLIEIGRRDRAAIAPLATLVDYESWYTHWDILVPTIEIALCTGLELDARVRDEFDLAVWMQSEHDLPEPLRAERAEGLPWSGAFVLAERALLLAGAPDQADDNAAQLWAEGDRWDDPRHHASSRLDALRSIDSSIGLGLARLTHGLDDTATLVRVFALHQLRAYGPGASGLVNRILALARESPWPWERGAALRCLPAIVSNDQRAAVGERLVGHHDPELWLHDEFAVVGDMVLSGWLP